MYEHLEEMVMGTLRVWEDVKTMGKHTAAFGILEVMESGVAIASWWGIAAAEKLEMREIHWKLRWKVARTASCPKERRCSGGAGLEAWIRWW